MKQINDWIFERNLKEVGEIKQINEIMHMIGKKMTRFLCIDVCPYYNVIDLIYNDQLIVILVEA